MFPFDMLVTVKEPHPFDKIVLKDICGLVCIKCGVTPKKLLNLEGLYYCPSCTKAIDREERWKKEENLWNEGDKK